MATATAAVVETPAQNPTEATSPNAPAATPAPAAVTTAQPASTPTLLSDEAKAPPATADEVKPPLGAPEKYEFTAPKGQSYDPQVIEEFSTAAKEANLTQDAAQKLIEKMAPALATRQQAQIAAIHQQWVEASTTDKEFGGDKLKENLGIAKKALATFSTPELSRLLEDTGLGNHPEVVRMLVRVGRAISEDGYVSGSPGPARVNMGDFSSIANALYPPKG